MMTTTKQWRFGWHFVFGLAFGIRFGPAGIWHRAGQTRARHPRYFTLNLGLLTLSWVERTPLAPAPIGPLAKAYVIVNAINTLRQDEGSSVTILCDITEGEPNNAIECTGEWTHWSVERFEGDTQEAKP